MNHKKNSWNVSTVKEAKKKQLRLRYAHHIASLIIDRKFSKIPMSMRFRPVRGENGLNENQLFKSIEKKELTKIQLLRDLAFVFFLIVNLPVSFLMNRSKSNDSNLGLSLFYSLTLEQILDGDKIDSFVEFLSEPRFAPLFNQSTVVVELKKIHRIQFQRKFENIEFTFDNSLWISRNMISRKNVFKIFCESIVNFLKVFAHKNLDNRFILRELIFDEPVWNHFLRQAKEFNVITTQSQYLRLPYVFYLPSNEQITRSMMWYSTNSTPIQNRKTLAEFDPEHFRFENIDCHYVWTEKQKRYLEKYNADANIFSVGSILFISKMKNAKFEAPLKNRILVFDVNPFSGLDVEVLYTPQILKDFIEDISYAAKMCQMSSNLYLKPKRNYRKNSKTKIGPESSYMNFIDEMNREKKLKVLDPHSNLYSLLDSAVLVIGIPFTSPVILAKERKVPSIFYVPESARDWIFSSSEDGVKIFRGRNQLLDFMTKIKF